MKSSTDRATGRLGHGTAWLFAFVGFLASIVTILPYFSESTPHLKVEITSNFFVLPLEIVAPLTNGSRIDSLVRDVESRCRERRRPSASAGVRPESRSAGPSAQACAEAQSLGVTLAWLRVRHDRASILYRYVIRNDGSDVARRIRLDGTNASRAEVLRGNVFVPLAASRAHGKFELPDVNPGEAVRVLVWTVPEPSGPPRIPAPRISFEGAFSKHEFPRYVARGWYDVSRRLAFLPPWSVAPLALLGLGFLSGMGASILVGAGKRLLS